ncbi:MAG: SBBP repeat-containing protein, partial [Candidatus Heimdallarchaeota archaeon]
MRLLVSCLVFHLLLSLIFLSFPRHFSFHDPHLFPRNASAAPATATNLTLEFSTYFGGSRGLESGKSIASASDGSFYITGQTTSNDFPLTENAFDSRFNGNTEAFLAKFAADGSLLWSTYLGGSDWELGVSVAVAADDSCYVTGNTNSFDFPTKNAYSNNCSGNDDVFLAKFATDGSLLWSTYLGGNNLDNALSITVAADGSCYVGGETESHDFPTTTNAFGRVFVGGYFDAFVTKFSTDGDLLWSTYLGGTYNDGGWSVSLAGDGSCYVTGWTASFDFPTSPQAYDRTLNGDWDVFLTKFSADGAFLWS